MAKIIRVAAAAVVSLLLAACDRPESIESLLGNAERLKELREQCRADRAKVGEAQCNAVAEATKRRFHGEGTPYTSVPAEAPDSPNSAPSDSEGSR
ncbi:EexN family lipoprotein [Variovorax sp.]|jgi:hypothetical protein|uniref:EexN family lipoprotein n=1 Tax=Variovorax sp. TaxID=1871043 RepID=UPI0037DA6478